MKALKSAYGSGHIGCLRAIIQSLTQNGNRYTKSEGVGSSHQFSDIIVASKNGSLESVKDLLNDPRVDPSAQDNAGKILNDMMCNI